MKKVLCLAVAVGLVKMTDDGLVNSIHLAVNFWYHCSKRTDGEHPGFMYQEHHGKAPVPVVRHSVTNHIATKKITKFLCNLFSSSIK